MRRLLALAAATMALPGCATAERGDVPLGTAIRAGPLRIVPQRIEEDSRCPASVRCIQAGTVRLLVRVTGGRASETAILTLGAPARVAGHWLTLTQACPYPAAPGGIPPARYRFAFAVSPTAAPGRAPVPPCR
jgi:hypothetical protein